MRVEYAPQYKMRSILRCCILLKFRSLFAFKRRQMAMDIKEAFGRVLKVVRKEKGFSQEKLSFEAGRDRSYVSKIETGVYQPSLEMIFDYAEALEIKPSKLVELVENEMGMR